MADPSGKIPATAQPSASDTVAPATIDDHTAPIAEAPAETSREESPERKREASSSQDDSSPIEGNKKDESSRPIADAADLDDGDPFSMFPMLSLTLSSTQMRRDSLFSVGRTLTRQETLQTIKTVRSRFTEVRSEFDENDDIPELAAIDENLVTFEGPDDPLNPKNWPSGKKWRTTIIMAVYAFLSPFASSILAPAIGQISVEFGETNVAVLGLLVSVFVLAFAIGPLIAGPASELFGRAIVLHVSMGIFFASSIGCALAQNTAQLAVFRFLSGLGGGAPLAIGAGVLADIWEARERGKAVAVFSAGPPIAPTLAPIIAGFIALRTTWRWVMWVVVFCTGFTLVLGIILLNETFPPTILGRKARRLRKETGNKDLMTIFEASSEGESLWQKIGKNIVRPIKLLGGNVIIFALSLYMALLYGYIYLLFITFPVLFGSIYHENIGIIGLNYIGSGVGALVGLGTTLIANKIYDKLSEANGEKGLPEYRLPTLFVTTWFVPIGLFWYGWSAEAQIHWAMPVIGTFWFGIGIVSVFVAIQNYLVDGFRFAASALAAATVFRSLFGFAFPLFGHQMYATLGYGWGNSLLGFLALAIGVPFPMLIYRYGARLRQKGYGTVKAEVPTTGP